MAEGLKTHRTIPAGHQDGQHLELNWAGGDLYGRDLLDLDGADSELLNIEEYPSDSERRLSSESLERTPHGRGQAELSASDQGRGISAEQGPMLRQRGAEGFQEITHVSYTAPQPGERHALEISHVEHQSYTKPERPPTLLELEIQALAKLGFVKLYHDSIDLEREEESAKDEVRRAMAERFARDRDALSPVPTRPQRIGALEREDLLELDKMATATIKSPEPHPPPGQGGGAGDLLELQKVALAKMRGTSESPVAATPLSSSPSLPILSNAGGDLLERQKVALANMRNEAKAPSSPLSPGREDLLELERVALASMRSFPKELSLPPAVAQTEVPFGGLPQAGVGDLLERQRVALANIRSSPKESSAAASSIPSTVLQQSGGGDLLELQKAALRNTQKQPALAPVSQAGGGDLLELQKAALANVISDKGNRGKVVSKGIESMQTSPQKENINLEGVATSSYLSPSPNLIPATDSLKHLLLELSAKDSALQSANRKLQEKDHLLNQYGSELVSALNLLECVNERCTNAKEETSKVLTEAEEIFGDLNEACCVVDNFDRLPDSNLTSRCVEGVYPCPLAIGGPSSAPGDESHFFGGIGNGLQADQREIDERRKWIQELLEELKIIEIARREAQRDFGLQIRKNEQLIAELQQLDTVPSTSHITVSDCTLGHQKPLESTKKLDERNQLLNDTGHCQCRYEQLATVPSAFHTAISDQIDTGQRWQNFKELDGAPSASHRATFNRIDTGHCQHVYEQMHEDPSASHAAIPDSTDDGHCQHVFKQLDGVPSVSGRAIAACIVANPKLPGAVPAASHRAIPDSANNGNCQHVFKQVDGVPVVSGRATPSCSVANPKLPDAVPAASHRAIPDFTDNGDCQHVFKQFDVVPSVSDTAMCGFTPANPKLLVSPRIYDERDQLFVDTGHCQHINKLQSDNEGDVDDCVHAYEAVEVGIPSFSLQTSLGAKYEKQLMQDLNEVESKVLAELQVIDTNQHRKTCNHFGRESGPDDLWNHLARFARRQPQVWEGEAQKKAWEAEKTQLTTQVSKLEGDLKIVTNKLQAALDHRTRETSELQEQIQKLRTSLLQEQENSKKAIVQNAPAIAALELKVKGLQEQLENRVRRTSHLHEQVKKLQTGLLKEREGYEKALAQKTNESNATPSITDTELRTKKINDLHEKLHRLQTELLLEQENHKNALARLAQAGSTSVDMNKLLVELQIRDKKIKEYDEIVTKQEAAWQAEKRHIMHLFEDSETRLLVKEEEVIKLAHQLELSKSSTHSQPSDSGSGRVRLQGSGDAQFFQRQPSVGREVLDLRCEVLSLQDCLEIKSQALKTMEKELQRSYNTVTQLRSKITELQGPGQLSHYQEQQLHAESGTSSQSNGQKRKWTGRIPVVSHKVAQTPPRHGQNLDLRERLRIKEEKLQYLETQRVIMAKTIENLSARCKYLEGTEHLHREGLNDVKEQAIKELESELERNVQIIKKMQARCSDFEARAKRAEAKNNWEPTAGQRVASVRTPDSGTSSEITYLNNDLIKLHGEKDALASECHQLKSEVVSYREQIVKKDQELVWLQQDLNNQRKRQSPSPPREYQPANVSNNEGDEDIITSGVLLVDRKWKKPKSNLLGISDLESSKVPSPEVSTLRELLRDQWRLQKVMEERLNTMMAYVSDRVDEFEQMSPSDATSDASIAPTAELNHFHVEAKLMKLQLEQQLQLLRGTLFTSFQQLDGAQRQTGGLSAERELCITTPNGTSKDANSLRHQNFELLIKKVALEDSAQALQAKTSRLLTKLTTMRSEFGQATSASDC